MPATDWADRHPAVPYIAPSLASEGFIYCTDGEDALLATGDRYYRDDRRPYVVLTIDLDAVGVPWRIDVPGTPYPHVYGPIPGVAIVSARSIVRGDDGRFLAIGTPLDAT